MTARRWIALALTLGSAAACKRPPPVPVEPIRFYFAPGLPGPLVAELAEGFRVAEPTRVATIDEAEVAWLRSPVDALALGERAVPGSAPERPRTPDAFLDPRRRFAPVGALARVIVTSARVEHPFLPDELRELADPRLRGKVVLTPLGDGEGPLLVAALELAYGRRGTEGWLAQLAANMPLLAANDAEVVSKVAAGEAEFGLTDSLAAGGRMRHDGLRLLFTDQRSRGSVTIPTALVVLPGAGAAARKFAAWLAGPVAEDVLVQRAIGLVPLREEATAPEGILTVGDLRVLTVDWEELAERTVAWRRRLAHWPANEGP